MAEVREVLEKHLDPNGEPSLAARSVYGIDSRGFILLIWFGFSQFRKNFPQRHFSLMEPDVRTDLARCGDINGRIVIPGLCMSTSK
jgi:hypothetical protein